MEIKDMNMEEIEARMAEINGELDNPDADIDALEVEVRSLKERKDELSNKAEKRAALLNAVNKGGKVVKTFEEQKVERNYNAGSVEYRNAFLKNLLGEELTVEERAAFVHTTATTPNVLPTQMLNTIWDLVSTQHVIMGDITIYRTGTIIEVIKHTAIAAGNAKTVEENAANDDEQNTFVKVTLSGKDFSKHVDVSYAMARMSVDALESYLTGEIARQLGAAMAEDVIKQIGTDMDSGNAVPVAELTFADVAKAFGLLERASSVCVYGKRAVIYNHLVGMCDQNGRPIFQPSAQPGAEGTILGAPIKVEDAVADNVILIGDPKNVVYNMVQDIMIESDRDIKKHVTTYSGYARGEGTLVAHKSFTKITVG